LIHASFFEMTRRDSLRGGTFVRAHLDLAREHAMPMWLAYGRFQEGWLHSRGGEHCASVAQMREGLRQLREDGKLAFTPVYGVVLAETEAAAGQQDAAAVTIDSTLATIEQTGQRWFLSEAQRVRGELLLQSRPADIAGAEAAFTQAIEVARAQSAKRFELRAAIRLARLWTDHRKPAENNGLLGVLADGLTDGSDLDGFSETSLPPD
jgi:predicted ATPase